MESIREQLMGGIPFLDVGLVGGAEQILIDGHGFSVGSFDLDLLACGMDVEEGGFEGSSVVHREGAGEGREGEWKGYGECQ